MFRELPEPLFAQPDVVRRDPKTILQMISLLHSVLNQLVDILNISILFPLLFRERRTTVFIPSFEFREE